MVGNSGETIEITLEMPESGQSSSVSVGPNSKINLINIDLEKTNVDIVGSDLIISDPDTGAQIVLLGMALYMFDEELSIAFSINGISVSAADLLSKVSEVGNLSIQDFIEISSILPENNSSSEEEEEGNPEEGEKSAEESESETNEADLIFVSPQTEIGRYTEEPKANFDSNFTTDFSSATPPTSIDSAGDTFNPFVEQSSSSSAAVSQDQAVTITEEEAPPEPISPKFIEARLLQVSAQDTIEEISPGVFQRTFDGGGGSEASFFSPENEAQYSTEVINLTNSNENLIVNADNPDFFSDTFLSRFIEIEPSFPSGFIVSELVIGNLPPGFEIVDATIGSDGYTVEDPVANANGNYGLVLRYDIPTDATFEMEITAKAEFDVDVYIAQNPDAPIVLPPEPILDFTINQLVEARDDVEGPNDLNFTNANGDLVWVVSNEPNDNRIFTGTGDDLIYGGTVQDIVNAGLGNDQIFGGRGDDILVGGGGDDILFGEEGFDTLDGEDGTDTVDYSTENLNVRLDLGLIINGYATSFIDEFGPNEQQDLIRNVENITTGDGTDQITGDGANNNLLTGAGNDIIFASLGADTLDGGADIDLVDFSTLNGSVNSVFLVLDGANDAVVTVDGAANQIIRNVENVIGTDGDDFIGGDAADNNLSGADGDDALFGGAGNDILDGGAGNDSADYIFSGAGVTASLLDGEASDDGFGDTDTFVSIESLSGSNFNDNLTGDNNANILFGAGGDDSIFGLDGDDRFLGSDGADTLDGGLGSDTVDYSQLAGITSVSTLLNGSSSSTITVVGGTNDSVLNVENVVGSVGNDTLGGGDGNNTLDGFLGDDNLAGGRGNDTLIGGLGIDTADYSSGLSGASINLLLNSAIDDGFGDNDIITGVENIIGSNFNDTIKGDGFVNNLAGGSGDDTLYGAGGDDVLDGGAGIDTADYTDAASAVNVDLSVSQALSDGDGGRDTFIDIENVRGSTFNDDLVGDVNNNALYGGVGDDTLDGAGGNDNLFGDAGDDTFQASIGNDVLDGGAGTDIADYSNLAGVNFINVTLNGLLTGNVIVDGGDDDMLRAIENIRATAGNDIIAGDLFANTIFGLGGNDVIRGGAGSDLLDGGTGTDELRFDELASSGISLNLASGTANYFFDASIDTFINFETYYTTLSDDSINGSTGADTVFSLSGNDSFLASAGADVLDGGLGTDTISYLALSAANFINVALQNGLATTVFVDGSDNDMISAIENIIGTAGDDTITGNDEANRLEGSAGNDTLSGGAGNDTLVGGGNDDILYGGEGVDILDGGSGQDTADYTAAANAVNVDLAGGEALADGDGSTDTLTNIENVTGSAFNDLLSGNGAANVISGGLGNDIITGGGGDDVLDGGAGDDDLRFDDLTSAGVTLDVGAGTATYSVDGSTDTFTNFEEYFGSNQADNITGSAVADTLYGLGGNDVFFGTAGLDNMDGGTGIDTIDYSLLGGVNFINVALNSVAPVTVIVDGGDNDTIENIENVVGSAGDDIIQGSDATNTLIGAAGNDTISGGLGSDNLQGGAGTDTVRFDEILGGGIVLNVQTQSAFFAGDNSTDTLSEFEIYYVSGQDDTITGSTNADTIFALGGADTIFGTIGADVIDGGLGIDTIDYSSTVGITSITATLDGAIAADIVLNGSGTINSIVNIENIIGSAGDDTITGDANDNILDGSAGNDTISGLAGNDILIGGLGNDILDGGADDDLYQGDAGDDRFIGSAGVDTFEGGTGIDVADYSSVANAVIVDLSANAASNDGQGSNDIINNVENVTGSNQNDTISGNGNTNILLGGLGDDSLYGAGGNDTLDGGAGTDEANYSTATAAVTLNLGNSQASDDGDGGIDTLNNIENIVGSNFDDDITGDGSINLLEGILGDDIFRASGGADIIDGGLGSDTIDYSAFVSATAINVTLNGGIDVIVNVTGSDNDTIRNVENVVGTVGDDIIEGDSQNNELSGFGGNDLLLGRGGNDVLDGGAGIDTADYSNAVSQISVDLLTNSASLDGDGGTDNLFNIENITGSDFNDNITGDASANTIIGGAGNDTLDGGAGDDLLQGGTGDDIFLSGAGDDTFVGGAGNDDIDYSLAAAAVTVDLLNETATNDGDGGGVDTIQEIENVIGSDFNDDITGDAGANMLSGGLGDDRLEGGLGNDILDGGAGSDTADYTNAVSGVIADLSGDSATGDGDDTFISIENILGSGNNDTLIGDGNVNILDGGAGNDSIYGAAGNDILRGGTGIDVADFTLAGSAVTANLGLSTISNDGDGGMDTVEDIENLRGSLFDDDLTGDSGVNLIEGNAGNDTIRASGNNDVLDGGAGADTVDYSALLGATAISVVLNTVTDATVTVTGGDDDTVRNIENVIGTSGNDTITGDSVNNDLDGGAGDDILSGRGGSDILRGGAGIDTASYATASTAINVDLSMNIASIDGDGGTDNLFDIENIDGSIYNDIIIGNAQVNIINGGNGNDTLDGGAGDDVINGGLGDDTILGGLGNDTFNGGIGEDTVNYSAASSAIDIDLDANETSDDGEGGQDTLSGIENIVGSLFNDQIVGSSGDNDINASDGDDLIRGLGGVDVIDGGIGNDTITYSTAAGSVIADLLAGEVVSDGDGSADTVSNVENIIGSNNDDILRGDNTVNTIEAGLGDDNLRGAGGNDILDGEAGVDTADYSNAATAVNVDLSNNEASNDGDGGMDTLLNIENVTGSSFNDILQGDDLDNELDGGSGNDRLIGGLGDDNLIGGLDVDTADYSSSTSGILADMSINEVTDDGLGGTDTLDGVENIIGTDFADDVTGDNNANNLSTGAGNDIIRGRGGIDVIDGGADIDTVSYSLAINGVTVDLDANAALNDGDGSSDTLLNIENVDGSNNNDQIFGDINVNVLRGLAGDDSFSGRGGIDTYDGGLGSDTADYTTAANAVSVDISMNEASDDGDGASDIFVSIENVTGSAFDDLLIGDNNANIIRGNAGADTLIGAGGSDDYDGGDGIDTVDFSAATNAIDINLQNELVVNDGYGSSDNITNVENVIGSNQDDIINGDLAINILSGGLGNDQLYGGGGDDTLDGQGGSDTANYFRSSNGVVVDLSINQTTNDGDGGVDTLVSIENITGSLFADDLKGDANANIIDGSEGNDLFRASNGLDFLQGGLGIDTVDYSALVGISNISVTLDSINNATVTVVGGDNDTIVNIENVTGTAGTDTINGDALANVLIGGAGNDVIRGGLGSDTLDGGADIDELRFDDISGLGIVLNLGSSTAFFAGDGSTDNFSNFESYFTSNQDDTIIGSANADVVNSLGGDDTFNASGGADVFDGGAGSDTINYGALAISFIDVTLNDGADATVTVVGGINDTIRNIENIIGSAGNDTITGDNQDNTLDGSIGDDILNGGAGTDTLLGGSGSDTFTGSAGQNTYDGGAGIDLLDYSSQAGINDIDVTLNGSGIAAVVIDGGINDFVVNVENVTGTAGADRIVGDAQSNIIRGFNGADIIGGGAGDDFLYGEVGNDRLLGDDGADFIDGGAGTNILDYEDYTAGGFVTVNLDGANNSTVVVATGDNDTIVNIQNVRGTDFDDIINGDAFANSLNGWLGNDTLRGGGGNDSLNGSTGDDILVGGTGADIIDGGDDFDTVDYSQDVGVTSINVTLNLSVLSTVTITGAGHVNDQVRNIENVIGTDGDDVINGDTQVNVLEAGAGNDFISGGDGDDILDGGADNDTLSYFYSVQDIVADMSNLTGDDFFVTVGSFGEVDTARFFENFEGGSGNDTITGDDGNNILSGLSGNDIINGGLGIDVINGGAGMDTLNGGDGNDTINGGADGDSITGGAGNDILNGEGGNDTFYAGTGADTMDAGAGSIDTVDYSGLIGATSITLDLNGAVASTVVVTGVGMSNDSIVNFERARGTDGNDSFTGHTTDNTFWGGNGNDQFFLEGGSDQVFGDAGTDRVSYASTSDLISFDASAGAIAFGVSVGGGAEIDTLNGIEEIIGSTGNDDITSDDTLLTFIDGNDGNDTIRYSVGAGTVRGGNGNDFIIIGEDGNANGATVFGDAGDDRIESIDGGATIDGGAGTDTIEYDRFSNAVTLTLDNNGDGTAIIAGKNNDTLFNIENIRGSEGNDIFTGNDSVNVINGDVGYDIIYASLGADTYDGDQNEDRVDYSTTNGSITSISVSLNGASNATVTLGGQAYTHTIREINDVFGTDGNDVINGDGSSNDLRGRNGNDTITGGSGTLDIIYGDNGDDILDGGIGNDRVYGGNNNDTIFASLGDDILEGNAGTDTLTYQNLAGVSVNISYTGAVGTSVLSNGDASTLRTFELFYLTDLNDSFEGSTGVDTVFGEAGNDTFFGSAGNDIFDGQAGSDTADYSTITGIINIDLLNSGTTRTMVDGVNTDFLTNIENIAGGGLSDTLIGNNIANVIDGNQGDDFIDGDAGNDTLNGGNGDDVIRGGLGDDDIDGGNNGTFGDYVDYSNIGTSVNVNLGTSSATGAGIGTDTLNNIENVYGSSVGDTITGDGNSNILVGNGGNDTINGGNGNDFLIGGAGADNLNGGGGSDTVDYTDAGAVTIDLQGQSATGDGNDMFSSVENAIGSAAADTIISSTGFNQIDGGAGSDTVDYSAAASIIVNLFDGTVTGHGNDQLTSIENVIGTTGNDIYFSSGSNNNFTDAGGIDTVNYSNASGVTINLDAGTASGHGNDTFTFIENAIGSSGNDTIVSSSADNDIDGSGGSDTVSYAASGSSVNINLVSQSATGHGTDSFTSIENAIGSASSDTITGNGSANTLSGGDGNDTINGGSGNDTLNGGNGADTLIGGAGNDALNGNGGVDTVDYSGGAAITGNLTGTITGQGTDTLSGIENLIGTSNNDTITGNSSSNNVNGGAGFDIFSYSNSNSAITLNVSTGTSTGYGNDALSNFEGFDMSGFGDRIDINVGDINGFNSSNYEIDGLGGNDRVDFNNSGGTLTANGIDGTDVANLFSDVEELDFTNTDLTGADRFVIGDNDIAGINQNNGSLTIFVNTGTIALTDIQVTAQGSAITGDSTAGNTRTIDWADGTQLTVSG